MTGDTVVIVDDERAILVLMQEILQDEGYRVVIVDHPARVDSAIAGKQPSLFLIDIMLPGVNGITVAQRLRSGGYGATPLLAMSASQAMTQHAARSGCFAGVLEKPFDLEHLLDRVAGHLATDARNPAKDPPTAQISC